MPQVVYSLAEKIFKSRVQLRVFLINIFLTTLFFGIFIFARKQFESLDIGLAAISGSTWAALICAAFVLILFVGAWITVKKRLKERTDHFKNTIRRAAFHILFGFTHSLSLLEVTGMSNALGEDRTFYLIMFTALDLTIWAGLSFEWSDYLSVLDEVKFTHEKNECIRQHATDPTIREILQTYSNEHVTLTRDQINKNIKDLIAYRIFDPILYDDMQNIPPSEPVKFYLAADDYNALQQAAEQVE